MFCSGKKLVRYGCMFSWLHSYLCVCGCDSVWCCLLFHLMRGSFMRIIEFTKRRIIFLQCLFWCTLLFVYVLCKTTNSNVFGQCLMHVHFACPICNCLTQILIPNINLEIASSLLSLSRLKINIWAESLTSWANPCCVT